MTSPGSSATISDVPHQPESVKSLALPDVELCFIDSHMASQHLDELAELYAEVYAEPPYEWGNEHVELFKERFEVQHRQRGFSLVEARQDKGLVGIGFGVPLLPDTPWWRHLLTRLPEAVTREYPNRTVALVELLVRAPRRRQHIATAIHDWLLRDRAEERATLTVLPAALPAQAAYLKWGWRKVAQKRNPLPGSPVFDVMVKELR